MLTVTFHLVVDDEEERGRVASITAELPAKPGDQVLLEVAGQRFTIIIPQPGVSPGEQP